MTFDEVVTNYAKTRGVSRDEAAAAIDALIKGGMISVEASLTTQVAPPRDQQNRRWHWLEVPAPAGRRTIGCFEWVEGAWWPAARRVDPDTAFLMQWQYVGVAEEPAEAMARVESANASAAAREAQAVVPPNLPLPRSMHLLRTGDGRQVKAMWHGERPVWSVADPQGPSGRATPDVLRNMGYAYVAALPDERIPYDLDLDVGTSPAAKRRPAPARRRAKAQARRKRRV